MVLTNQMNYDDLKDLYLHHLRIEVMGKILEEESTNPCYYLPGKKGKVMFPEMIPGDRKMLSENFLSSKRSKYASAGRESIGFDEILIPTKDMGNQRAVN